MINADDQTRIGHDNGTAGLRVKGAGPLISRELVNGFTEDDDAFVSTGYHDVISDAVQRRVLR